MTPAPSAPQPHDAAAALLRDAIDYYSDSGLRDYENSEGETISLRDVLRQLNSAYLASREEVGRLEELVRELEDRSEAERVAHEREHCEAAERERDALREALGTSWCKMGDMQVVNCIHNGCYQAACPFKEALARSAKPCCVVCDTDAACEYPGGRPKHCPRNIGAEP